MLRGNEAAYEGRKGEPATMPDQASTTQLLLSASRGDQQALDRLFPLVYEELRGLADRYLQSERSDHTLQPTALVHEAYLRLVDQTAITWQNRAHFFSVAAQVMRHILVDHARAHRRMKRGGGAQKIALDEAVSFFQDRDLDLLALDEALAKLATLDSQQNLVVELRFFGGLTIEEVAEVLKIAPVTVNREWRAAKIWLHREMST